MSRVGGRPSGAMTYALVSLGLAAIAAPLSGTGERAWGIAVAWVIQAAAIWPLDRDLSAGQDARRAWLSGIALRGGGLIATGALSVMGVATRDLPVTYGISMLVLLLGEAGWLARRVVRGTPAKPPARTKTSTGRVTPDEPGTR